MFFRTWMYLKNLKSLQAVSGGKTAVLKSSKQNCVERISRRASGRAAGSLTVEAALVFPLFLFGVTAFLYLFLLLRLQTQVERILTDTGRELAQEAYLTAAGDGFADAASPAFRSSRALEAGLSGKAVSGILSGGIGGISTSKSRWDPEKSVFTLEASYQVVLPPGISWFHPVKIVQKKTVRGWTGFGSREKQTEREEEIVYVTDHGTVYHRSLACRHLKLSVRQAGLEEAERLRNDSGGKYYPCERCWKNSSSLVYITESGDRYHGKLNCPGLTRGIHAVLLSETGGLPPCSACGR